MKNIETIEQLKRIRSKMPNGKKDPWAKCCNSKRILLYRAMKRNSISELTAGELMVVEEWLDFYDKIKKENELNSAKISKKLGIWKKQ